MSKLFTAGRDEKAPAQQKQEQKAAPKQEKASATTTTTKAAEPKKSASTSRSSSSSLKDAAERVVVILRAPSGGFSTQAREDALDELEVALGRDPSDQGRAWPELTVEVAQGEDEPVRLESTLA